LNRRTFLKTVGALSASLHAGGATAALARQRPVVNDIHSQLNRTAVDEIVRPRTVAELARALERARRRGRAVSVAGGRHAMGGQQFARGSMHVDTRDLARVIRFDRDRGHIEVEAGIQWPALVQHYLDAQQGEARVWGFAQKQTGADRFTIGGSLGANGHGRALTRRPLIADVESFRLMDANGEVRTCSRTENAGLFGLAIGGYGLFGVMTAVTLRLVPRRKVERVVEMMDVAELIAAFDARIRNGFLYGDCQFEIDPASETFLQRGVFSCYRPVEPDRPIPAEQKRLSDDHWRALLRLAHVDKREGFRRYETYYLGTTGQLYWSDLHQMGTYLDDYHAALDEQLGAGVKGSEMIGELYVPRAALAGFMAAAAEDLRRHDVNVIYGTIRLIERDGECFLAWARQAYACVIFNLHTEHSAAGIERSAEAFRRLIDLARERDGSYFLTYHRWARRDQVEACYPQFREFLRLKEEHDPGERFQSEWWRHQKRLFGSG
jgi:FAD/FMN-containing dehydrogenase